MKCNVLLLSLFLISCQTTSTKNAERQVALRTLSLKNIRGEAVQLGEKVDSPMLVMLLTTWSLRAQAEAPLLIQMYEKYKKSGLQALAILLDSPENAPLCRAFANQLGFPFEVILASPDSPEFEPLWGRTHAVPRTLLIGIHGDIILDNSGQTDLFLLEKKLNQILK